MVRVTSIQPISEPFVSLLLDVGWPQGRLLREYTVLLDPPAFARPDGRRPAGRLAAPPVAAGPAPSAPAIRRPAPAGGTSPGHRPRPARPVPRGIGLSGPDGDSLWSGAANETLWGISERLRPNSNVSVNQMMLALYRANPEAFAGNINRLGAAPFCACPGAAN